MSVKIGKWDVPKDLFDDYIKTRIIAGSLLKPESPYPEFERRMRWQYSIVQLIKIHKEICDKLKIPYSEEIEDEFYSAFTKEVNQQVRLKG